MRQRSWKIDELRRAVADSRSIRQVIKKLKLIPAGGNYKQIEKYIKENSLSTDHFLGQGWNLGLDFVPNPAIPLKKILIKESNFQTHKLKKRLFKEKVKQERCEICGWAEVSADGRIPLELNHKNGDPHDHRLKNLEILCPNCHSLKPHYRGSKLKNEARVVESVYTHHLK